jgi:hypothetical protein
MKDLINGKWQPSFVGKICIGIEKEISSGYSRVLLNTILPDTDKEYKKQKEEIEGLVKYICDLHNKTITV